MTTKRGGNGRAGLLLTLAALLAAAALVTAQDDTGTDDGVIVIDGMSHWFGPVAFPHEDHQDMVDDCTDCHHHADGETEACDTCHDTAWSASDPAMPPLNVAYHRACAGCHREMGGPTACEACHERRALPAGPALRGFATP